MEKFPKQERKLDGEHAGTLFREYPETGERYTTESPPHGSPYKTAEEKLSYERTLPTVIQPFIRAHFEKYAKELEQIQLEPISEYTKHLKEAWSSHLAVNKAIDTFLTYESNTPFKEWSPLEWQTAKRLLVGAMDTDVPKGLYSVGLKKKLDAETARLKERYFHVEYFEQMLLMPSFATFYEERDLDHKRYELSVLDESPDKNLRQEIIERYYAGDPEVFELRNKDRKPTESKDGLRGEIETTKNSIRERAAKKGYFMSERPDVKAFEELMRFDNTTEYEYTYSLQGLPDLFLREEILKKLVSAGLFSADTSVFALSKEEFIEKIDTQIAKLDVAYEIKIRPYRQHYDTCGTSCIMSVLNRQGLPLTEENELAIWSMVGKPYNFPGGLGWVLQRHKLHATFLQDDAHILNPANPEFADMNQQLRAAAREYVNLFDKALDAGMQFEVEDWGYDRVREEIQRGNLCLIYINVTDTVTHVILGHGYKNDQIIFMDPLGGTIRMDKERLEKEIVNPMGKRMVIVNKLPNDLFDVIGEELTKVGY